MTSKDIRRLAGTCAAVLTAVGGMAAVPKLIRRLPPGKGREVGIVGYSQMDWFSCGYVAALDTLHTLMPPSKPLRRVADALKLWRELSPDPDRGVSMTRLVRTLRRRGIRVCVRRNLDLAGIVAAVDMGWPVITTVGTADPEVDHWTVVCGYSRRPTRVCLSNTAFVRGVGAVLSWREFVRGWTDRGFGLVCSIRRGYGSSKSRPRTDA